MNSSRRSFFKLFGAAAAITAVAPSVLLPRAGDAFRWKRAASSGMWIVNPEWITAPYEIQFCLESGEFANITPFIVDRLFGVGPHFNPKPGTRLVREHFPMRLDAKRKIVTPMVKIGT